MAFGYLTIQRFVTLVTFGIFAQTIKTKFPNKIPKKCNFVYGYIYGFISQSFELWPKPYLKEEEKFEYSFEIVSPLILLNIFDKDTMFKIIRIHATPESYQDYCDKHTSYLEGVQIGSKDARELWLENKTPSRMADGFLIPQEDLMIEKNCYDNDSNKDSESFELIEKSNPDEDFLKKYIEGVKEQINKYYDDAMK